MQAPVVIDTNVVLDLFVFSDPRTGPLRQSQNDSRLQWLATPPMREELRRVLDYPQLQPRLAFYALTADQVLARFDQQAKLVDVPAKASVTCSDPDDQKFIDLAVAHQALLLSKDKAVLSMRKRLLALAVPVDTAMQAIATATP